MKKCVTAALLAVCLITSHLQAGDIDEMDGFWRRSTIGDVWLKSGGSMITIPDYIQDTSADFYYTKRPCPVENPFADNMILVRPLGGWEPSSAGEGAEFSDNKDADFIWHNGSGLSYDKAKLINRIQPYIDAGYGNGLTIVFDNIPWGIALNGGLLGPYGQRNPAEYDNWIYWMSRRATQYLVEEYGTLAQSFVFRFGTETEWGNRFNGDAITYFNQYKKFAEGVRHNLPNAKIGPGNFTETLDSEQSANLMEFLGYVEADNASYLSVDFISASAYYHSNDAGMEETPYSLASEKLDYMDEMRAVFGNTALSGAKYYLDEFGTSPFSKSEEPGIFGAANTFQAICRFLDNGIDKIQHWKTYEVISPSGNKVLFDAEANLYTVFDYCEDWDASVFYLDSLLTNGIKGTGMVIKGPEETIIILSAVHKNRTVKNNQNFTFSFPKSKASFSSAAGVTIEYLSLDQTTSVYDIARDDLAAQSLITDAWTSGQSDRVNRISKMGGTGAKNYIANNWSTYEDAYIDSMKLGNYSGSLTENGSNFELQVSNMKTPSIMVFKITNGAPIGQTINIKSVGSGDYVSADANLGADRPLAANRASAGGWEKFEVIDAGGGMIALKATINQKYVAADNPSNPRPLEADRSSIGSWVMFTWQNNGDGTFSLKANANNKWVSADASLDSANWPLAANRTTIGNWEKFTFEPSN